MRSLVHGGSQTTSTLTSATMGSTVILSSTSGGRVSGCSSNFAWSCVVFFGRDGLTLAKRALERVPGKRRALHARREAGNAGENRQLAQVLAVFEVLASHQSMKTLEKVRRLGQCFALNGLRQYRGRCDRDGAAGTLKAR